MLPAVGTGVCLVLITGVAGFGLRHVISRRRLGVISSRTRLLQPCSPGFCQPTLAVLRDWRVPTCSHGLGGLRIIVGCLVGGLLRRLVLFGQLIQESSK